MPRILITLFFLLLSVSVVHAEPKSQAELEKKVRQLVTNNILRLKSSESFLKEQTERVAKGETPPFVNGVPFLQDMGASILKNQVMMLGIGNPKLMDDFMQEFTGAIGMDAGSCVGTKAIKELWCQWCSKEINIFGFKLCIERTFESAIYYRYPTQSIELAYTAYQSGFTAQEILKMSQLIRDNDFMQLVGLLQIKKANLKTLVQNMPKKILDEMQIKYECMTSQSALMGLNVASGAIRNAGGLGGVQNEAINRLMNCMSRMSMQNGVMSALNQTQPQFRQAIANGPEGGQKYTYTQVPNYTFRYLYENVFKKMPNFRIGQYFKVGLGSLQPGGFGFVMQPFLKHKNLPPFKPGIKAFNVLNLGKAKLGSMIGGPGEVMDENGEFPKRGGIGGIGGIVRSGLEAAPSIPGAGDLGIGGIGGGVGGAIGGLASTAARSLELDPFFLDGHQIHKMIPTQAGLALSPFPSAQYSMFSLLAAPLSPFATAFMSNMKDMSLCDVALKLAPGGNQISSMMKLSDTTPGIGQTFRYLQMLNPILGERAKGYFDKTLKSTFGSKNPPCFAHGFGPSGAPTTSTRSNKVGATVVKSIIDSRFIPFSTMMYNPETGRVGVSTYHKKIFERAEQKLPKEFNEFSDLVGLQHSLHLDMNPRPTEMLASLPKTCSAPEIPEAAMADFGRAAAPLDPPRIISEWTAFQMCHEGTPLNEDVAKGDPMLRIGWMIIRALGGKNFYRERYV